MVYSARIEILDSQPHTLPEQKTGADLIQHLVHQIEWPNELSIGLLIWELDQVKPMTDNSVNVAS